MTSIDPAAAATPDVVIFGEADDVTGFALAGIRGRVCRTVDDLRRAFEWLDARAGPPLIVLLSPEVAALDAAWLCARIEGDGHNIVVVLP